MTKNPRVTVIIPFFQRSEGLLAEAVRSIQAQLGVGAPEIIVVDDGSPVRARDELEPLLAQDGPRIHIVDQPNAGPGAARNTGLNSVPAETEYVAFLDSDDKWLDNHLKNALYALDLGYDLYFADCLEEGEPTSHFEGNEAEIIDKFDAVPGHRHLAAMESNRLFSHMIRKNVIGPSSVVFRFRKFSATRFPVAFWNGEDRIFWLDLLHQGARAICSKQVEVIMGKGVGIYRSVQWGSDRFLRLQSGYIAMRKEIAKRFHLTETNGRANAAALAQLRRATVACVLNMARNGSVPDLRLTAKILRQEPRIAIDLPRMAVSETARKLLASASR